MKPDLEVVETTIPDVKILRPRCFGDSRGFFFESWNAKQFSKIGLDMPFVQDNHSRSVRWTLRGMHYQLEQTQGKLIRAATGKIFDVAVDLRQSAPSFGQWVGVTLSDDEHEMLWIPPGFAHGFLVLSETADSLYKCTNYYSPEDERTIRWDDEDLNIAWPIPKDVEPLLSAKDREGTAFRAAEYFR